MRQASQNQQLEGQRAELMLAAQRLRGEADEAFSQNEEMKIQARSFINAAEAGYQTLQEQAQNQFMEMAMNHRQQIAIHIPMETLLYYVYIYIYVSHFQNYRHLLCTRAFHPRVRF